MTDITMLQRIVESSPAIVAVLLVACWVLWRTLREEIAACRELHADNIKAQQETAGTQAQLAKAIDGLTARIEGHR
jgi:ABC-type nickel/cobalt efflux system permease component RcnA